MDENELKRLLSPFVGSEAVTSREAGELLTYLELLLRWNARMNLTAVRDVNNIVTRHFGESLFLANRLFPNRTSASVIDVGSGAGFPGLPLKIRRPELALTLVESQGKKATFLKEVVRTLRLEQVEVYGGRAEDLKRQADVVTLRAVDRMQSVLRTAAALVRNSMEISKIEESKAGRAAGGGRLAVLAGQAQIPEIRAALPDFFWQEAIAVPMSSRSALLIGQRLCCPSNDLNAAFLKFSG